jgi:hypothetical protein
MRAAPDVDNDEDTLLVTGARARWSGWRCKVANRDAKAIAKTRFSADEIAGGTTAGFLTCAVVHVPLARSRVL